MIIELRKTKRSRSGKSMTDDQQMNNKLLDAVRWVCRARSDDDKRLIINYLSVNKDGDIAATDGYRLHKATVKTDKLPAGIYRVLKTGAVVWLDKMPDSVGKFPDYEAVIPKTADHEETIEHNEHNEILFAACVAASKASGGGTYNAGYMDQAIPADKFSGKITFLGTDKLAPIMVQHDIGTAVIVPLRIRL